MVQRIFNIKAAFYGPHFQVFERQLHNSRIQKKNKTVAYAPADCVEFL